MLWDILYMTFFLYYFPLITMVLHESKLLFALPFKTYSSFASSFIFKFLFQTQCIVHCVIHCNFNRCQILYVHL